MGYDFSSTLLVFFVIKASFNGSYFAVLQNTQIHWSLFRFLEIPSAPKQSTPYSIPCCLILKQSNTGSLQFNASSQHGALSSLFLVCVNSPSRLHKISLFLWFLVFIKLWKHKMRQCFTLNSGCPMKDPLIFSSKKRNKQCDFPSLILYNKICQTSVDKWNLNIPITPGAWICNILHVSFSISPSCLDFQGQVSQSISPPLFFFT